MRLRRSAEYREAIRAIGDVAGFDRVPVEQVRAAVEKRMPADAAETLLMRFVMDGLLEPVRGDGMVALTPPGRAEAGKAMASNKRMR